MGLSNQPPSLEVFNNFRFLLYPLAHNDYPCFLRCCCRWCSYWQGYHGVEVRCCPKDPVAGWKARGLRTGRGGHGCREEGRELWVSVRQNLQENRHCRLWPVLDFFPPAFSHTPNVIASHWAIIMY